MQLSQLVSAQNDLCQKGSSASIANINIKTWRRHTEIYNFKILRYKFKKEEEKEKEGIIGLMTAAILCTIETSKLLVFLTISPSYKKEPQQHMVK